MVSGIETSPFEACLSLLLSNLRPQQRAGNVTRSQLGGVRRQRGWLAHYTLKWKWQRAVDLLINHQQEHLQNFTGNVTKRFYSRNHSPQQLWAEQSNHLEEKLLTLVLLGGSNVMKHCGKRWSLALRVWWPLHLPAKEVKVSK